MDLPDVNIWLALLDERHPHHPSARRYWMNESATERAFNRVTSLAFLRLSTRSGILSGSLSAAQAWTVYHTYRAIHHVRHLPEPDGLEPIFEQLTSRPGFPHRLWTDAYLAAFAIASGCRLVSFDSDFSLFPDLSFLHLS